MGRRIAFELLAAKGYKEGMVPYISNQYEKDAKAAGSKIKSYGKEVGLVTDKLVLEKVFNNRYSSWVEFKLYPDTNSRVLKLKKAIYKAYLDQTNDFRRSIFENKK
ncbi:immunoglobulin A1 protease [Streptococcus pneumoniae]|nr:immunoglobulin A1 protease [Streptococcus pneumoniae]